jgi:hypothetical protein
MGQFTRRAHRLFDVYLICLLFLAPILFGMEGMPRLILWVLCAAHLVLTAFIRVIPFTLHGMIEICVGIFCPFAPVLFGFWDVPNARHFFIGLGFGLMVLWVLTDYKLNTSAWNKEAHVDCGVDITAEHLNLH